MQGGGGGGGVTSQVLAQDDGHRLYGNISYFVGEVDSSWKGTANGDYDLISRETGADVGDFTIDDVENFKSDINSVALRFGHQFHPNFSVEGRFGLSAKSKKGTSSVSIPDNVTINMLRDDGSISGTDTYEEINAEFQADTELDSLYGIYWRASIPANKIYPYTIIGYTIAEIETSKGFITGTGNNTGNGELSTITVDFVKDNETQSGISYGVGADFHVNDNLAINAEWMSYLDKDELDISGASLSLVYKFKIPPLNPSFLTSQQLPHPQSYFYKQLHL